MRAAVGSTLLIMICSPGLGEEDDGRARRLRADVRRGSVTQNAADLGLWWLAHHQDRDGKWDADEFVKHDSDDDVTTGPGAKDQDVQVTGLALLAFLGGGHPGRRSEPASYRKVVQTGLRWLIRRQDERGRIGSRDAKVWLRNHAIAATALCEGFWWTRAAEYKKPARRALDFIEQAVADRASWDAGTKTETLAWCVVALKAGKLARMRVDPRAFEAARMGFSGESAVRSRLDRAATLLCRVFLGEHPSGMEDLSQRLVNEPPLWHPEPGMGIIDMHYWHFGSLAMFQVGGSRWREWNKGMRRAVVRNQHAKGAGARTGSWDPIGVRGGELGRVGATALMVATLEVYYRYDRVFGGTRLR